MSKLLDRYRALEFMCAINQWQASSQTHPLMCAADAAHPRLIPLLADDNSVVLVCVACDYRQETVPHIVLQFGHITIPSQDQG